MAKPPDNFSLTKSKPFSSSSPDLRPSKLFLSKLLLVVLIVLINVLNNSPGVAKGMPNPNPGWSDAPYDDNRPYLSSNSSNFLSQFNGSREQGFLWTSESRPELELMNNQLGLRATNTRDNQGLS